MQFHVLQTSLDHERVADDELTRRPILHGFDGRCVSAAVELSGRMQRLESKQRAACHRSVGFPHHGKKATAFALDCSAVFLDFLPAAMLSRGESFDGGSGFAVRGCRRIGEREIGVDRLLELGEMEGHVRTLSVKEVSLLFSGHAAELTATSHHVDAHLVNKLTDGVLREDARGEVEAVIGDEEAALTFSAGETREDRGWRETEMRTEEVLVGNITDASVRIAEIERKQTVSSWG